MTSRPGAVTAAARPMPPWVLAVQHRAARTDGDEQEGAEQLSEQSPPLLGQIGEVLRPRRFAFQQFRDPDPMTAA